MAKNDWGSEPSLRTQPPNTEKPEKAGATIHMRDLNVGDRCETITLLQVFLPLENDYKPVTIPPGESLEILSKESIKSVDLVGFMVIDNSDFG